MCIVCGSMFQIVIWVDPVDGTAEYTQGKLISNMYLVQCFRLSYGSTLLMALQNIHKVN